MSADSRTSDEILAEALPEALAVADRDGIVLPPEPLASILGDVARHVRRYVVLSPEQASLCALWVLHAHAIEVADVTPYLIVTSPERRCGKSRLLEVLGGLVPNAWHVVRPSDAVLFRKLAERVTLFLDEVDAIFSTASRDSTEGIRATLNAGFERSATVPRCNDHGRELKDFPVFGAKVLAGIGDPPDTVRDRGFVIALRRARRSETRERFRRRKAGPIAEALKRRIATSITPHVEALRRAEPRLPEELNDRAQDAAEPLLAIADLAGGEWPVRARAALGALAGEAAENEVDDASGVALLRDISTVFMRLGSPKHVTTEVLVRELRATEATPWAKWNRDGLDATGLARLLRPFKVRPRNLKDGRRVLKGYEKAEILDAAERYVPSVQTDPDEEEADTVPGEWTATIATALPAPPLRPRPAATSAATNPLPDVPAEGAGSTSGSHAAGAGPHRFIRSSASGSASGSALLSSSDAGSSGVAAVAAFPSDMEEEIL